MYAQKGNVEKHHNVELVGKAEEAFGLARAFANHGEFADACEMYDAAFIIFAGQLGETHPLTLQAQREYGALLTVNHMLAQSIRRRMN
jgi:hypothetical protein